MRSQFLRYGLASAILTLGLGLGSAQAFFAAPGLATAPEALVTPAAMCGRHCAGGGRHIPGPPDVCYRRGLTYCGPSRDPAPRAVIVPVPGVDIVVGGPRRRDRERCDTVTVRRADGSVRTSTRCR